MCSGGLKETEVELRMQDVSICGVPSLYDRRADQVIGNMLTS